MARADISRKSSAIAVPGASAIGVARRRALACPLSASISWGKSSSPAAHESWIDCSSSLATPRFKTCFRHAPQRAGARLDFDAAAGAPIRLRPYPLTSARRLAGSTAPAPAAGCSQPRLPGPRRRNLGEVASPVFKRLANVPMRMATFTPLCAEPRPPNTARCSVARAWRADCGGSRAGPSMGQAPMCCALPQSGIKPMDCRKFLKLDSLLSSMT